MARGKFLTKWSNGGGQSWSVAIKKKAPCGAFVRGVTVLWLRGPKNLSPGSLGLQDVSKPLSRWLVHRLEHDVSRGVFGQLSRDEVRQVGGRAGAPPEYERHHLFWEVSSGLSQKVERSRVDDIARVAADERYFSVHSHLVHEPRKNA